MSEEQSFLDALAACPHDDTARLVYADWLDEHNQSQRAEYLRLAVAVVACGEDSPEAKRLLSLTSEIADDWVRAAGSRFATVLYAYETVRKIQTIKLLREANGMGLADAKGLSESLPCRVVTRVPYHTAVQCRDRLRGDATTTIANVYPMELERTALPQRPVYKLVGMRRVWGTLSPTQPDGMAEFREFVRRALGVSEERAAELAASQTVELASNVIGPDAQTRLDQFRRFIPNGIYGHPWYLAVVAVPTGTVPNDGV